MPDRDEKNTQYAFPWCYRCSCLKACYFQHGEKSANPQAIDPECSNGPAR